MVAQQKEQCPLPEGDWLWGRDGEKREYKKKLCNRGIHEKWAGENSVLFVIIRPIGKALWDLIVDGVLQTLGWNAVMLKLIFCQLCFSVMRPVLLSTVVWRTGSYHTGSSFLWCPCSSASSSILLLVSMVLYRLL